MTSHATEHADAFELTVDAQMALQEGSWDGGRSRRELRAYATDGENLDVKKASRGFTVGDLAEDRFDALKLPIAYVKDGSLVGIGNGIRAALARLPVTDDECERMAAELGMSAAEFRAAREPGSPGDAAHAMIDGLSSDLRAAAQRTLKSMLDRLNKQTADSYVATLGLDQETAARWVAHDEIVWRRLALAGLDRNLAFDRCDGARKDSASPPSGRVWRWSRHDLSLDAKHVAALDRAIEAGQAAKKKITGDGDWRRRTEAGRGRAEIMRAAAASLRADGFDDLLTDEGFLKVSVWAARTGTQIYTDGRSMWGEYRSEQEVGSELSLRSWDLKPFCDDHPPVLVDPSNYTEYAVGTCGQDAILCKPTIDGYCYVKLTILVGDLATLIKIREGKVELSAGYTAILVAASGRDCNGIEYSYAQTEIRINHLALVDAGRAGPLARISVDGGAWQVQDAHHDRSDTMTTQTPATQNNDQDTKMENVDVGGVTFSLPKDMADKLRAVLKANADELAAAKAEAKTNADALAEAQASAKTHADGKAGLELRVVEQDRKIAEQDGKLAVLERTVAAQAQRAELADREALLAKIAPVCPGLAAKLRPDANSPIGDGMTIAEMRAAAVVDLAPTYAKAIAAYKPKLDGLDGEQAAAAKQLADTKLAAFIEPVFDHEISQAAMRRTSLDNTKKTPPQEKRGTFNDRLNGAVHGSQASA